LGFSDVLDDTSFPPFFYYLSVGKSTLLYKQILFRTSH
jgi:hypothetical protein